MGYDDWLVRDYEAQQEAGEYFTDWAEREGYDLCDPEQEKLAEREFEVYLQDCAEAAAEAAADRAVDRMLDEAEEGWCEEEGLVW